MSKLIYPPRNVWANVNGVAENLTLNYVASAQVGHVWHNIGDATEVMLLCTIDVTGGVPTSIEILPRISYDGGVTFHYGTAMEWNAGGFAGFGYLNINPPVAAPGGGIATINPIVGPIPLPGGCSVSFVCKRTAGHANNTLLVQMTDGAVG